MTLKFNKKLSHHWQIS